MEIIKFLDNLVKMQSHKIYEWMLHKYQGRMPPIYSSTDIRRSGFKIAPVDTNLFPAGFNNISDTGFERAKKEMQLFLEKYHPKNILIIPEEHTRNLHYLDNINVIKNILSEIGYNTRIASFYIDETLEIKTEKGFELMIHKATIISSKLTTGDGFTADFVVLNNDLTSGIINELTEIGIPIFPNMNNGWYKRTKSRHFDAYNALTKEFSKEFGFDPRFISTKFATVQNIDFKHRIGLETVETVCNNLLNNLKNEYLELGIKDSPFLFIKADRGTYGMGVMSIQDPDELRHINKKIKNKMGVIKGGILNTELIIQEGVPTIETLEDFPSEPMIYMVNGMPIDNIFRINKIHDKYSNLNSKGMEFRTNIPSPYFLPDTGKIYGVYGLIAILASLASAYET